LPKESVKSCEAEVSKSGCLFLNFFAVFPARRAAGLFVYVSGAVSAERGAAMGGHCARRNRAARADFDLYLPEYGAENVWFIAHLVVMILAYFGGGRETVRRRSRAEV